ncbi:MAG: sigma-70 family RNA polymerase sigma factor [Pirellulaceae bacterium]|jgi:RNA polymerase sigma-70 factor (ECF subfamily)|nr:sigma-70 family RNA polymerase sigma factor [Pirellulaceae bacterium]
MVDARDDFRAAMAGVRAGSPEAVWKLIAEYGPHVQRVVRRRLDRRMRSKFDSLDFVQMVWASVFRNPRNLWDLQQPEDLVRYLAAVARHKVIVEYRRRIKLSKYNVTQERSLDESELVRRRVDPEQSSPSQIAMAREQWERYMRDQPERDRTILQMRIGGATFLEISQQLGIHERTARKVIARLAQL